MMSLEKVIYKPIAYNVTVEAIINNDLLEVSDSFGNKVTSLIKLEDEHLLVEFSDSKRNDDLLELIGIEYLLGHNENIYKISIPKKKNYNILDSLSGSFSRGEFFELRAPWYKTTQYQNIHNTYITTKELLHPLRENPQDGYLYSRYVPALKKTISFRVIDEVKDLNTFSDWHNQERVNKFWELKGTKEEHLAYIKKLLADNHAIPLIAEIDGEAYGYFELYWAYEDRLGPYYPSNLFDRGFHFLIGNSKFLGLINTDSALKSLVHMVFLDDGRTTKLMAEPRSDNEKVIKYVDSFPVWKRLYEFDFPHKRALLIEARREVFFTRNFL